MTPARKNIGLAHLCQQPYKKLYAASARLYGEAFADQPDLARELGNNLSYNAACVSALAGTGQGEDKPKPDEKERTKFRQQALDWLRADLAAWSKQLDENKPMIRQTLLQTLGHWKEDEDLSSIRDKDSLAKLSEVEQDAFRRLWAEVDQLLGKVKKEMK
jgi:serine/threonine-protein kinase